MKILIVRIGAMGDVLHAIPAVTALRRARPDWQIDWVVDERWLDLLIAPGAAFGPVVHGVWPVRTRAWNKRPLSLETMVDVLDLRRHLREQRYDLCIDLQGTMRSAVIGWMAGAKRFVGPREPREGPALHLYGESVRTHATHVIPQAAEIVSWAIAENLIPGAAPLPLGEPDERWASAMAEQLTGHRGIVVIAPTSGWRSKEWPPERFGLVARHLATVGYSVVVNATATASGVNEVAAAVVAASGNRAVAIPCTIGQLAALLRRARLLIGGDTGPLHLADALGIPVLALFGPTDPARTGPLGPSARVLRHPGSVTDHGRYKITEAGLAKITVDVVIGLAEELLAEHRP